MNLILYLDWKLDCNFELFQSKCVYLAAIHVVPFQFFCFVFCFCQLLIETGCGVSCLNAKNGFFLRQFDTDGFDRSFSRSFHLSCVELTI